MDAQQQHDQLMAKRRVQSLQSLEGSRGRLETLLREKSGGSSEASRPGGNTQMDGIRKAYPGITDETIDQMAAEHGF